MRVEIIHEWLGNKPGTVLDLIPVKAFELVNRGAAKFIDKPVVDPFTGRAYEEESEETETEPAKAIEKAPKDKMIRRGAAHAVNK